MAEHYQRFSDPEREAIFLAERRSRDMHVQRLTMKRWFADECLKISSSTSRIPEKVDAIIVLSHGQLDQSAELPFGDLLATSTEAVETEHRVRQTLADALVWMAGKQDRPIVGLVGTNEQALFMQRVAQRFLQEQHTQLQPTVTLLATPDVGITSTRSQLATMFQFIEQAQYRSVAVSTSDYHVPRVEQFIRKHEMDRRQQQGQAIECETTALWVPWAYDARRMSSAQTAALEQREEALCIRYLQEGTFPRV